MPDLFRNLQWAVTDVGMSHVDPDHFYPSIPAERLLETDIGVYDWLPHMAEKEWVDLEAFIEAFHMALHAHMGGRVDVSLLQRSIAHARELRALDT